MSEYKHMHEHDELIADNPNGLDTLKNPHNFSSNPGFMSTANMLQSSGPAGGGVIRGTSARGSLPRLQGPSVPVRAFNGR